MTKTLLITLLGCLSLVCGWLFWEYMAYTIDTVGYILPAPSQFLFAMIDSNFSIGLGSQSATVVQSIFATLMRVFAGLLISIVSALIVGIVLSEVSVIRYILLPYVQLIAPIAPIAWIPLALVLFGIGNQTAIFIVFLAIFPSLVLSLMRAISLLPDRYLIIADNIGCSWYQKIWYIVLPATAPSLITSIRINFIAAWMAVLAAEMTGLRDGLGALIMTGRNLFDNNLILFGMCLIGCIGYLFDVMLSYVSKKIFWRGNL